MKYLIVGDIQERLELTEVLLAQPEHVIFVGDVLDSFQYTSRQHIQTLDLILNAVHQRKATLLLGNHEASYLYPEMRASGWKAATDAQMLSRRLQYLRAVEPMLWYPDERVLITHAGLSRYVWDGERLTVDNLEDQLFRAYHAKDSWYYAIGRTRGGRAECGGPLWCDWYVEFESVPGITQVFGHSRFRHEEKSPVHFDELRVAEWLRQTPNGDYCIDCLHEAPLVLEWDRVQNTFAPRTFT